MSSASRDSESWLSGLDPALLSHLTPEERAEWDALTEPPEPPLWSPLPGPQQAAYDSPADELLYGGAAGGGKTDLLLGLAGTRHHRSIIFRREFPRLRAMIDRSREIYNRRGASALKDSFNEQLHLWRLVGGRQVEFGSIAHLKDVENYRGRPHDLYAWDEVTEFTEAMYRQVNGWLRTTREGQRCRVVAASNPPTSPEGRWVCSYWGAWVDPKHPNPAAPGELRWYAMVDGQDVERPDGAPFQHKGQTLVPRSRTFIPAKLQDNPYLFERGYGTVLQNLPEPLRSQLLLGDFTAGVSDDPWQIIPTAWVEAAQARWRPGGHMGQALEALGVDVARGGKAQTVLAGRRGFWFAPLEKHPGKSTPDGPAVVRLIQRALAAASAPGALLVIDANGIGASVYDQCAALGHWCMAFLGGSGTDARDQSGVLRFANLRAFAYWSFRELLDPAGPFQVQLPPDKELLADLTAAKWENRGGKVFLESKDKLAEPDRLGRSTDCGDAVVQAALLPAGGGGTGPRILRA